MYRYSAAKKTGIVKEDTKLTFLGFGTMNGKDGKPFKTREGGVMRLENLIREITEKMYEKITENRTVSEEEAKATAKMVGMVMRSNTETSPTRRKKRLCIRCRQIHFF